MSGTGEVDTVLETRVTLAASRSADYKDWNNNGEFDIASESFSALTPTSNGLDPEFGKPVYSLSADLTGGVDPIPIGAEYGGSVGVQDNNEIGTVNLYAPFRWLSSLFSD